MPSVNPIPELVLYTRAGCGLCDEAREAIRLVVEDRQGRRLVIPSVVEVDITADPELERTMFDRIPIAQLGERRVELVVTVGKLRRLLNETLGDEPAGDPSMPVLTEWS